MNLKTLFAAAQAQILWADPAHEAADALHVVAADLMSDVLAFAKDGCILLTGMVNQHVIRTAEMLDVLCITFVRGKKPTDDIIDLAKQTGVTLLCCDHTLYEACGKLYQKGLPPCQRL